jgi:hypothetical protein
VLGSGYMPVLAAREIPRCIFDSAKSPAHTAGAFLLLAHTDAHNSQDQGPIQGMDSKKINPVAYTRRGKYLFLSERRIPRSRDLLAGSF